eukprot:TRINITY_DN11189_c0_g1_i1.p1 TRINITY_DN11189_c0_g1~~TRINITY_DN11189_c0_g1_i1.p1  ORF type:complete len:140 (-),score=22.69 TRINITY_DN11189_c0_g1_i1:4-423(-)
MSRRNSKSLISHGFIDALAGINGGIALVIAGHPLDTLKVRMQTMNKVSPHFKNALDCAVFTFKNDGILGFYKGMVSPLFGVIPRFAMAFFAFGFAKRMLTSDDKIPLTTPQYYIAGAFSGFACLPITCLLYTSPSPRDS